MDKMRVMTVVGTRPEIIRLSQIIKKLDENFDHILVHTGQNYDYELNEIFFEELGLRKPDIFLNAAGETSSQTIGNVIKKIESPIVDFKPEAFLILGDTNSCMTAITAKRNKIPIFHLEAGNRCFDSRVPEEILRKIIDHTSDINLTYSDIAREYLLKEGIPPDRIIKIGSPMKEIIVNYQEKIRGSDILSRLNLNENCYFLVSAHREENVDNKLKLVKFLDILNSLVEKYNLPIIVSTHPRTRNKIESENIKLNKKIILSKPFGYIDYIFLQLKAFCVISDSGSITEESSILDFPAINLREVHERPEGSEEMPVLMTGLSKRRIIQAISLIKNNFKRQSNKIKLVKDYSSENVSEKVIRIILSYKDYVKREVWKDY